MRDMHLRFFPNIKKYVTLLYQGVLVDSTNVIIKQKLGKCKLLNCQMSHNFRSPWIRGQLKSLVSVSILSTFYNDNVIIQNFYSNKKKTKRVQNKTVCMLNKSHLCVALSWTHYLPKFYPDWPYTSTGLLVLDLTFTDVGQLELGQASKWLHILHILAST